MKLGLPTADNPEGIVGGISTHTADSSLERRTDTRNAFARQKIFRNQPSRRITAIVDVEVVEQEITDQRETDSYVENASYSSGGDKSGAYWDSQTGTTNIHKQDSDWWGPYNTWTPPFDIFNGPLPTPNSSHSVGHTSLVRSGQYQADKLVETVTIDGKVGQPKEYALGGSRVGDAEGPGGAGAREPYVPSDSVWGTFWSALGDSALNLAERLPLVNHLVDGEGARQRLLDRGVSASTLATSEGLFDVSTELLATAATGGTGKLAKGATKIYNLANKGQAAIDGVQAAAQGDARGAVLAAASFLPARKGKNPVSKTLGAVDPDDAAKLSGPVRRASSRIHGNSLDYVGDTHVYSIRGPNGTHKIGESMQGVRVSDGASIRGEAQARALTRETGQPYSSEIRRTFPDKASARDYETRLIERFRRMFGDGSLLGNKTNR